MQTALFTPIPIELMLLYQVFRPPSTIRFCSQYASAPTERSAMSQLTKGYVIAMTSIVILSTTGILIGYLLTNYALPSLLLAFWRNFFVCVALAPALFLIRPSWLRIEPTQLRFYASFGLILALFNSIWTLSVETNGAAVATVLAYSSAGFTAALAWWIFRERMGLPKIAAIILSLVGCVLVSNAFSPAMWNLNPLGILTGLTSGMLYAGYNVMGKESAKRKLNTWTTLFYTFAFAALFTLIFNLVSMALHAQPISAILPAMPVHGWFILILLAFIPTLVGFGLYNTAMNYLSASTVSLLATSEPAMTAVEAYIFLDERMSIVQIVGSLIILSAVVMVRFARE